MQNLLKRIREINETAVPPNNEALDCRGDPKNFDGVWTNFGDKQTKLNLKGKNEEKKNNKKNNTKKSNQNKIFYSSIRTRRREFENTFEQRMKIFNNSIQGRYNFRRKSNKFQEPSTQLYLCSKHMSKSRDIHNEYFIKRLGKDFMDIPILQSHIKNKDLLSYERDFYKGVDNYKKIKKYKNNNKKKKKLRRKQILLAK